MSTDFSIDDHFPCSPKALYDLLSNNEFDDSLMKAIHMEKSLLSEEKSDKGAIYKIRLTNPEEIPTIAKKFTGDHLSYIETRTWANLGNTWVIEPEVKGANVEAKGTTEILDDPNGGCIRRTKGKVSVSLPLIGKKIEEMVMKSISETFKQNADYCRKHIKDNQIT